MPRRLLLPLLCLLGLAIPTAAQAAPEAGMNLEIPFSGSDLQNVKDSGAKTARFFMYTSNDPSQFDGPVAQLASIGVKPVFVLVGDANNPPTSPAAVAAFAQFAGQAATHFKGKAAGWEIWNEEDAPKWWAGMSELDEAHPDRDASQYVPLLKATNIALKAADPATPVVMGGLTGNDYKFVQSVYDHGGGGSFDVVATHTDTGCAIGSPYGYYRDSAGGPISQWAFLGYRSVHDVMAANGDAGKQIWLTEFGWSSTTTDCQVGRWAHQKKAGVGEADQAKFTTQAFHCLGQDPYVTKALLFTLNETPSSDPMFTDYGAVRNGTRKPVFNALQTFATRGDTLPASEGCGDFQAPDISVSAPTDGAVFAGPLAIKASATDASGVPRITYFVDGDTNKIRNFTSKTAPTKLSAAMSWMGAKKLANGAHTITVVAIDPMGNVSSKTVHVTKVDPSQVPSIRTTLLLKLSGKGGKRTLKVQVKPGARGLTNVLGKINVIFAKRSGRGWKIAHKYGTMAKGYDKRSKAFKVKLQRAQWRVIVTYGGSPGYARATSSLKFSVR
jgi:Big-like domain-containing protein